MKTPFPTVQEQTEYWNKKEGLELERVSRLQETESRTDPHETGEALRAALEEVELRTTQAQIASRIGKKTKERQISFLVGQLEQIGKFARESMEKCVGQPSLVTPNHMLTNMRSGSGCSASPQSDASNPQEQASTTAKTLTQQEEEDTSEWFDEQEARWSLRDQGRNDDGAGESYAERNV